MMTEKEMQEILDGLQGQLTGTLQEKMLFLNEKCEEYSKAGESDLANAIVELAMKQFPPEQMEFLQRTVFIDNKPMDVVYRQAVKLMQKREYAKALELTEKIYDKIRLNYVETNEKRCFSFRNLLESNLYYHLYHPTKNLERAPFDFSKFLAAHAYCLTELRRAEEAIPVLELAIRYNPMNPDPRFELAEIYKILGKNDLLLTTIRETLAISTTPYALARSYENLGFYCVNIREYADAVCFYFESLVFADNPAIVGELQHVSIMMGKKLTPPTRKQVIAAFEKHDVMVGPNPEVLVIAKAMADHALGENNLREAIFYLTVLKGLTNDAEIEAKLAECIEKAEPGDVPENL